MVARTEMPNTFASTICPLLGHRVRFRRALVANSLSLRREWRNMCTLGSKSKILAKFTGALGLSGNAVLT